MTDKFHPSKLSLKHTARSSFTYQLNVNNFKTERYDRKSIMNKCTLDWNNLQKILKQTFPMMKRSDLKTNIKNYFLKQYNDKKVLKMKCNYFLFAFFSCPSSCLISLFFFSLSAIFLSCVFLKKISICL